MEEKLDEIFDKIYEAYNKKEDISPPVYSAKHQILELIQQARIDELEKLKIPRNCLRPNCTVKHNYLNKLHIDLRLAQLKKEDK